MSKQYDAVAFGSCYLDINSTNFPFDQQGIPTEVELVGNDYEVVAGGSAVNFCRLLAKLGLRPAFIGMVGQDPLGDIVRQLLEKDGVHANLVQSPAASTAISDNVVNPQGQQIMLVHGTANDKLTPEEIWPVLQEAIANTNVLFMGGCFKMRAFESAFAQIADLAKQHGTKIAVDHARLPADTTDNMRQAVKDLVLRADYYFPSHDEFCELWQVDTIEDGLRQLHDQAPQLIVTAKNGANGVYYYEDGAVQHIAAQPVTGTLNTVGAGDSFNAAALVAFVKGKSLKEATQYGCQVAAAKITGKDLPNLA